MSTQSPSHQHFMQAAIAEAMLASQLGEVPVGAVVVVDGEIVARAHNQVEARCDASLHAEIVALRAASEKLQRWRLNDAALYVTMEPCTMCFGAIVNFRIKELFFGCYDQRHGAVGSLYDLSGNFCHLHEMKIYPELLADPCREIVQEFFKEKRNGATQKG